MSWYDAVFYCNARSRDEVLEPCYYVLDGGEFTQTGQGSVRVWNRELSGEKRPFYFADSML